MKSTLAHGLILARIQLQITRLHNNEIIGSAWCLLIGVVVNYNYTCRCSIEKCGNVDSERCVKGKKYLTH